MSSSSPPAWDPVRVKQAIDMELNFNTDSGSDAPTHETLAKSKARNALPVAMDSIIHLAVYSDNETMRFKAATYLVDRVLGRVTDVPMYNEIDDDDPLTKLVKVATANTNNTN